MAAIRSRDTKPEKAVRSALHRAGFRFRVISKVLPGKPDLVLPRWRAVVFVNGCFWHQHAGCRDARIPASNVAFWKHKLHENVRRDRRVRSVLRRAGWGIFVIWECEVHRPARLESLIRRLRRRAPV